MIIDFVDLFQPLRCNGMTPENFARRPGDSYRFEPFLLAIDGCHENPITIHGRRTVAFG
jgi:hypothetical protein